VQSVDGGALALGCALSRLRCASGLHSHPLIGDTRGAVLVEISMLGASRSEFQLVQMVVDNWRHQGGDVQVRSLVEVRNHIREILVRLKPGDLQYSLSVTINRDT